MQEISKFFFFKKKATFQGRLLNLKPLQKILTSMGFHRMPVFSFTSSLVLFYGYFAFTDLMVLIILTTNEVE